jgi:DNA-binding NarL/FixJ family response regulator
VILAPTLTLSGMARRRGHPSDEIRKAARALLANQAAMLAVLLPHLPEVGHVPTDGDVRMLTPRERQVAELVGQGLTNQQVATRLGVSLKTVQSHVYQILPKLNFNSRAQIILWLSSLSRHERAALQDAPPRRHPPRRHTRG